MDFTSELRKIVVIFFKLRVFYKLKSTGKIELNENEVCSTNNFKFSEKRKKLQQNSLIK